jgi:hypothetical protein
MNNLQVLGKFLDQPMLVSKFQKAVPAVLATGAAAFTAYDASKEKDPQKRKQRALKTGITLGVTVASALAAPHIASAVTKRPLNASLNSIKAKNTQLVNSFVKSSKLDDVAKNIVEKSKDKVLNFGEVKTLYSSFKTNTSGKKFLEKHKFVLLTQILTSKCEKHRERVAITGTKIKQKIEESNRYKSLFEKKYIYFKENIDKQLSSMIATIYCSIFKDAQDNELFDSSIKIGNIAEELVELVWQV